MYTDFKNKKVILLGGGKSCASAAKYIYNHGGIIELREKNKSDIPHDFHRFCSYIRTGDKYLDNLECDILVKTPVIRPDIPEIENLRKSGALITSEAEIFFETTKAKIIAVTGSSGKTTTVSLIYQMLIKSGKNAYIGGNIGIPLLEYPELSDSDIIAAELSSFQLASLNKPPHTAVVTNIYPNHLDVHKNFDEYVDAKRNIVRFSPEKAVLNLDDNIVREFYGAKKNIYFSMKDQSADVFFKDGYIYLFGEKFFDVSKIKIAGKFNINNYMAATAAVTEIGCADGILRAAEEFSGVPHRNQFIANIGGTDYFDSSIDSSPDRTAATLSAYSDKVILLAGGRGKGVPYNSLEKSLSDKVRLMIITGENADELVRTAEKSGVDYITAGNYAEAVRYAKKYSQKGDKVLLSPASTSFDAFKNFEERGDFFKKCVLNEL